MSDVDLQKIRQARLAQLQEDHNSQTPAASQEDDNKERELEARKSMLATILSPEAADRLGRVRLVKESRATNVENRLIMLARSGQLQSRVTENQLKELLAALAENEEKSGDGGVRSIIDRRKQRPHDDDLSDD